MRILYDIEKSIQSVAQDFKYSLSIILTMSLTLGIALFLSTVVYTVQFKPLPEVELSERIVWATLHTNGATQTAGGLSHHVFKYLDQHQTTLEKLGRVERRGITLSTASFTEQIRGVAVSPSMFQLLGVNAYKGRVLQPGDDIIGQQKNIVISFTLWSQLFNKSDKILNETVTLNGEVANIVGVMPEGFKFPINQDLWFADSALGEANHGGWNSVFGRIKDGNSLEQVQEEFARLGKAVVNEYPEQYKGKEISVGSFTDRFAEKLNYLMIMLKISIISILLMGCFSICNMIIVKNLENAKAILIKLALGLPKSRIILNLLLESFWLCFFATVLGITFCFAALHIFRTSLLSGPYWWVLEFEAPLLLMGIFMALAIWVLTAIAPLWMVNRQPTNRLLAGGRKGSGGAALIRVIESFSALQIFSAFVLAIFTGVLIVGLVRIANADYGVPRSGYLVAQIELSGSKFSTLKQRNQYYQRFIEQAKQTPGIKDAAVTSSLPGVAWGYTISYTSTERSIEINNAFPQADEVPISTNYFSVMKMHVSEGRAFDEGDKSSSEAVAVINQSAADILFPSGSAVGKQFLRDPEKDTSLVTIVGVVEDIVNGNPLWYLSSASKDWRAQIYRPISQVQPEWDSNSFVFQTDNNPIDMISAIKEIARDIDPEVPLYSFQSFEEFLSENEAGFRRLIFIFAPAALLSLIIAALGVYSITMRTVLHNMPDIGIMRAIGIEERFINRRFFKTTIFQLVVSIVAGIMFATMVLPRLPSDILIADQHSIFIVCGVVTVSIALLVLFATALPLTKAHRITPREALDFLNVGKD